MRLNQIVLIWDGFFRVARIGDHMCKLHIDRGHFLVLH